MEEAVAKVAAMARGEGSALVVTANAEMIMMATEDDELMRIINTAELVVPDGAGAVWAANHLGFPMPERVAGYDLVQEVMKLSPAAGYRIFLFGSAPGIAERARARAESLYPGINIVGTRDGFFSAEDEPEIIEEIRAASPHILLAALGVPKQEKWLARHRDELCVPVSIGVGGTLDVMAGAVRRAPLWMQRAKLEWLWRAALQPSRAMRLAALPRFVLRVMACRGKKV